jgi:ABC-type transport system substrate-binding protein
MGNERTGHGLTRSSFLKASGGVLAGTGLLGVAGCDALSTKPAGQDGDGGRNGVGERKGKEAPMLAEMVRDGELPPVEERLPEDPMVVEPTEKVGIYGGEWRSAIFGTTDTGWLNRTVGYENLARWHAEGAGEIPEAIPNVAEDFEFNEEGTEHTVRLRRGIKWSDGEPFTADDLVFVQNDVYNNEELYPAPPWPATAEKVDDYTIRFVFEEPEGLFVEKHAGPLGIGVTNMPLHHLRRFHEKYNPDLEQLVEEEGAADWIELFLLKSDPYQNPELPTLRAWRATNTIGDGNRLVMERNPYYWKVDPDGSQLPYIDRAVFDIVQDPETVVLRASNGEIDMMERTINTLSNKPVLARNRESGGYRFFDRVPTQENFTIISLNLTHKDPVKREVFRNKDFRIGLSHAINRQEIIDVVFVSQGEPYQAAPRPESPFYDEELAKQYTEYDVDLASEHLDKAYPDKNDEGVRLDPDGNPISFAVEFASGFYSEWSDALELVQGYWREVGIDVNVRPIDRSLFYERKEANQHDANVWEGAAGLRDDLFLEPRWYFPFSVESNYAIPWATWFASGGAEGQEPPDAVKEQMDLYDQLNDTTDEAEQDRLFREILNIAREQFYVIGINLYPPGYGIATNRFRNVPEKMLASWIYQPPGITNPEQYFIEDAGQ